VDHAGEAMPDGASTAHLYRPKFATVLKEGRPILKSPAQSGYSKRARPHSIEADQMARPARHRLPAGDGLISRLTPME
jgi:hypothetical protein